MAPFRPERIRDECMILLDKLHKSREQKLVDELKQMQQRSRNNPSHQELMVMWTLEAKLEGQFAYMRRLMRTEGFVLRAMSDFDSLDLNGSNSLDPQELQDFLRKRDGQAVKMTILENRSRELLKELDVDGDGKVSRQEWLLYLTYLHWQSFQEDNVVERTVEHVKEYKPPPPGQLAMQPVLIESVIEHPPISRSLVLQGQGNRINQPLKAGMFGNTGTGAMNPNVGWGGGFDVYEQINLASRKFCCLY